ncbi:MAG: NAD(+)/NADH kinase [Bacteroidales bacterium]
MQISIYGKVPQSPKDKDLIKLLFDNICKTYDQILVWQPFFEAIGDMLNTLSNIKTFNTKEELKGRTDMLLSLGGDGTMLDTLDYVLETSISVLGINLGHLGFLTTAGRNDITKLVQEIKNNNFTIEKRQILISDFSFECNKRRFAANEACFLSTNRGGIIDLEVFINDKYVSTFSGDGLLISTPTGSTAYSMSVGGPIITPESKCLCLTPIAPHNLTFRPVIISDQDSIRVRIPHTEYPCKMLMDGYTVLERNEGEITLKKAPYSWNLVRLKDQDFYFSIRNKLMWGQTPDFLNK